MSVTLSISKDITKGFIPHTSLFTKLHEVTEQYNYSSAIFTDGYRDSRHVQKFSSVMIYDFDTGALSINELAAHLKAAKVTALITTSRNHMKTKNDKPACERFRLIVKLSERLIIAPDDYSEFYIFFARVLNIDKFIDTACKDSSRFYYPNPSQSHQYILTGYDLDSGRLVKNFHALQAESTAQKHTEQKPKSNEKNPSERKPKQQNISHGELKQNELPRTQEFETKQGEIKQFSDFEYLSVGESVTVRCVSGSHVDKNPSAFITRVNTGDNNLMVYCHSCGFQRFIG